MCHVYSRFKKWLAYNPPFALGMEEWRSFKAEFKTNAPIRYFFHYTVPKKLYPMQYRLIKLSEFVIYRTTQRYHVIDTGQAPGYMSIDDRMLYGMFNLLKDYVEKNKARKWRYVSREKLSLKFKLPFYYSKFYRNPENGIKYLEWETSLDDPSLPANQQSVEQAETAREILALYKWWVNVRPAQFTSSPPDFSDQGCLDGPLDPNFDHTAEDYQAYKKWIDVDYVSTGDYYRVDNDMLCRLIKIRGNLW